MAEEKFKDLSTGLYWKGKKTEVDRVSLPFQTIETINESRATRKREKKEGPDLFKDQTDGNWYNRLIWGDNKYIMASLLEEFAGKIDLIYIDPPFATGADFSVHMDVGEIEWTKEPSAIEEKAYRDTWGSGLDSYLQMMYDRLIIMRELLSETGSLYVHCDYRVNSYLRIVMDEIFGKNSLKNEIVWRRAYSHNDGKKFGVITDSIYYFTKTEEYTYEKVFVSRTEDETENEYPNIDIKTGKRFKSVSMNAAGQGEARYFGEKGLLKPPKGRHWIWTQDRIDEALKNDTIFFSSTGVPRYKQFADDIEGKQVQSLWTDFMAISSRSNELLDYPTQKPEVLLDRIIKASSNENDLVADFFCGSGTTGAVAEKLGRRWIMADLGRYAIHTTRKRLLGIDNCKPFVVQNMGKYERQFWQGVTFKKRSDEQMPIYEYIRFILKLYNAEPLTGMMHIHGKKGKHFVHVGAVDAPVTLIEIKEAIDEVKQAGQRSLDILGWEWEMGLHNVVEKAAKESGIHLRLLSIPRDVMDPRAAEKGDVTFYELAYLEVEATQTKSGAFKIELKDFAIPNLDLIPQEVRDKIKKWSDYIDYWSVDWDWNEDTFHNMWQSYRTRKERKLELTSDAHKYENSDEHKIMVKVIDIFGNDTTHVVEVKS